MQEIMKIFDIHTIPNRGIVIGGTNPTLDTLSHEEIQNLVGKFVEIHTLKSAIQTKVIDMGITIALTGRKNIFLLLPLNFNLDNLDKGSVVYCKLA